MSIAIYSLDCIKLEIGNNDKRTGFMERSYIASSAGLQRAKREFTKKGWTQQILADFARLFSSCGE